MGMAPGTEPQDREEAKAWRGVRRATGYAP